MVYEKAFEKDLFISYAHIDNLPLKEGEKGWIEEFHRALEVRLAQLMGEKPKIWRDQKLQGNDFFGDEIVGQFPKTAVMISILSPRYLKSEWCIKEIKEFSRAAFSGIGIKIENKSRIFKVIKTAVPYDAHPDVIADTLGYEFYIQDSSSGRVKELSQKASGEIEQVYWAKLDDIAHDIRLLLEKMKEKGETASITHEEQSPPLTVYLAETGSDLKEQQDMIKRELMEFGYRVLPDSRLPLVESEFKGVVENFLNQAVLSIHLVGGSYGMIPEGSQSSIIDLQNKLAAEKSKTRNLQRLIWLLPDSPVEDDRQKQFVQRLRTDDNAQEGADLFETSIEEFRYAIHDKLKEIKSAAAETAGILSPAKRGSVYVAETSYGLRKQRESIRQKLVQQGYKVLPGKMLPLVHGKFVETVDNLLDQCEISIHIMGKDYGVVPDRTDKSVIQLQYERARQETRQGQPRRLVRIAPGPGDDMDERQRSFIDNIIAQSNPGDDIFEAPDNNIEAVIFEKLKQLEEEKRKKLEAEKEKKKQKAADDKPEPDVPPLVYLICDQTDLDNIVELEDCLYDNGFEVIIPAFEGNEEDLIADHRENLKSCAAVLIYYGQGNELWMRSITRDLTKIAGYGREDPLELKAVFLAAPAARQKTRLRMQDTLVIDGINGFSPGLMEPFNSKLNALGK